MSEAALDFELHFKVSSAWLIPLLRRIWRGEQRPLRLGIVMIGNPTAHCPDVEHIVKWLNLVTSGFKFLIFCDVPAFADGTLENVQYYRLKRYQKWLLPKTQETLLFEPGGSIRHMLLSRLLWCDALVLWHRSPEDPTFLEKKLARFWLAKKKRIDRVS